MKSSKFAVLVFSIASLIEVAAANAARVDMKDPRRALGREDDVRVDAELSQDTVSSGAPVGVTVQVENLSKDPIAIADKVCDISYDPDSQAVVVSIGTEVPKDARMPKMVVVAPNEKKTFSTGGIVRVQAPANGNPFVSVPRVVQIKVNFLRGIAAFRSLLDRAAQGPAPVALNDAQFEQWLESNDTVLLNDIPVEYSANPRAAISDASQRAVGSGSY